MANCHYPSQNINYLQNPFTSKVSQPHAPKTRHIPIYQSGYIKTFLIFLKLHFVELGIKWTAIQQLLMTSAGNNFSLMHYQNHIG